MLPAALLGLALSLLALRASSDQTETQRQTRSDVRTMMDKLDPNFWPTRGRRSSSSSEETPPPFWAHRGRAIEELESILNERFLPNSDETAPPFWAHRFWAHRGRAIEELESILNERFLPNSHETAPPFWAHRGRGDIIICPEKGTLKNPLSVEEPRWVTFNRRDAEDGSEDRLWISQGHGLEDLGSREHEFWVSRGKKLRSEKKDPSLRSLLPQEDFYPSRGKRALATHK